MTKQQIHKIINNAVDKLDFYDYISDTDVVHDIVNDVDLDMNFWRDIQRNKNFSTLEANLFVDYLYAQVVKKYIAELKDKYIND